MTVQVICDFDGTIAESDMISAIIRKFAPGSGEPLIQAVLAGRISIKEGVESMFGLLPSSLYDDVVDFARSHTIVRKGFESFIHSCGQLSWDVAIVSGGFDFFVHPVIHSLFTPVDIYCNRVLHDGDWMRVSWGFICDEQCDGKCGLCKPSVMRELGQGDTQFVVIGDGVTDFKAAKLADYVFARSSLLNLVQSASISFSAFDTFYDIVREMEDRGSAVNGVIRRTST